MNSKEASEYIFKHYDDKKSVGDSQWNKAMSEAIRVLKNDSVAKEMLEKEEKKKHKTDFDRGRITGFYDALGINYFE